VLYEPPIHRPLGDLYMCVEFGDELAIEQNFLVIALDIALREEAVTGVHETIPTHRSLGIVYDPAVLPFDGLSAVLRELEPRTTHLREIPSRVVSIPVWYDDPWSVECAAAHGLGSNLAYLAELNGLTVEEAIAWHTGTLHWVAAVGFQPATFQAVPLDRSKALTAPKYKSPRTWTPDRTLCIAGQITSFYPVESPGGYQLLGRLPANLYDPEQRNPDFADGPVLPRVGDRHRYVSIGEEEYERIRVAVEAGTHAFEIEPGTFALDDSLAVPS
jgi:urea carboxylase